MLVEVFLNTIEIFWPKEIYKEISKVNFCFWEGKKGKRELACLCWEQLKLHVMKEFNFTWYPLFHSFVF